MPQDLPKRKRNPKAIAPHMNDVYSVVVNDDINAVYTVYKQGHFLGRNGITEWDRMPFAPKEFKLSEDQKTPHNQWLLELDTKNIELAAYSHCLIWLTGEAFLLFTDGTRLGTRVYVKPGDYSNYKGSSYLPVPQYRMFYETDVSTCCLVTRSKDFVYDFFPYHLKVGEKITKEMFKDFVYVVSGEVGEFVAEQTITSHSSDLIAKQDSTIVVCKKLK